MKIQLTLYTFLIGTCFQIAVANSDCNAALGMESGTIKDEQITSSHFLYGSKHYAASNSRLNLTSASGSWCSEDISQHKNQYIQIDLLKNTKIVGIATQGRAKSQEYIEAFRVAYQRDKDGSVFRKFNESGVWKEFVANKDQSNTVRNNFKKPIIARYIRIYPLGEEFAIYCTRLELYGCKWTHELSSILQYSAPYGGEKQGVDMRDNAYDGVTKDNKVYGGLGKLTDGIYGKKDSLLDGTGSPWVAYNTKTPEITFEFQQKRVVQQIMVHVNNNNKDIKIFEKVDIYISKDNVKYTHVKEYKTNNKQHKKIAAYPVVINIGEVVTKYLKMKFTKQGDWLLISEVVFMTNAYPPREVVPPRPTTKGSNSNNNNGVLFTFKPMATVKKNEVEDKEVDDKESKGLSFPIILTIALVTIVLAVVVAVIIYKSYKKNRKQDSVRCTIPPQTQLVTSDHKQDVGLLYDERLMALHHAKQQNTIIPQNGMYMQPVMQGNGQPMIQGNGYNTQVIMS